MKHWNQHAKQWHLISAPLRPSVADIDLIFSWISNLIPRDCPCFNVLLLGATPELASIVWPTNTHLFVLDASLGMIQSILLPEKLALTPTITVGNWLNLPYADSSIDLVIGDGCFSMLPQNNYDNLVNEILRVLKPAGFFCMRFFTRLDVQESLKTVHRDFINKKIDNFHVLKWRIAMSLQKKLAQGVCLHDIWDKWNTCFKKEKQALLWSEETRKTIEIYKDNPAKYTFPSLTEISFHLYKKFNQQKLHFPSYTLGERCPIIQLQSKILDFK